MNHRHIVAFLILVFAAVLPSLASAKVTRVGPTQFHKQMHLPNAIGRTGAANNDDGYTAPDRRQQRAKHRKARMQDQSTTNNNSDESRTASDSVQNHKRKGRRDRQHEARLQRMQDRAANKAVNKLADKAKSLIND